MSYGLCPECGGKGLFRERRPNGNDKCENGHTYPSKNAIPHLTPVDDEQCQTEVQSYNAFSIGGSPHKSIRCEAKPVFIVTEVKADDHGQQGAMSLCAEHLLRFQENTPNHDTAYIKQTVEGWRES